MKIYITYEKKNFNATQIEKLEKVGEIVFLEKFFNLDEAHYIEDTEDKILAIDPDWYKWCLDEEHLKKIPNLKGVCLSTTAYDWVDLEYCKKNNIFVSNIPKYSTDSVAEYACFLMFCLAKKLPLQMQNHFNLEYSPKMVTNEIKGKTMGIIGLGTIGSKIAEIGENLGMHVIYWNRKPKDCHYEYKSLESIFKESDFIFPTFATNEETSKLITDDLINSMDNSNFINVINNPSEIYNHKLMVEKAEQGKIGYAFEFYDNESVDKREYKGNVMVTPSYAWYTKEALARLLDIWCDNMKNLAINQPSNLV